MKKELLVLFFVLFLCVVTGWGYSNANKPSAKEMQRTYDGYRACIQTSQCLMTAQDYIEYYNLKWQLEEQQ